MPASGARLDTVFGAPLSFEAGPGLRTRDKVAAVHPEIQHALAAQVKAACESTAVAAGDAHHR